MSIQYILSIQVSPSGIRKFWMQWFLGNSLGWGLGISIPILVCEIFSDHSEISYQAYSLVAFLSCGIWVGLAQWIALRQIMPISSRWAWYIALSPLVSFLLAIPLIKFSFIPIIFIYPIIISLGQWQILRKFLSCYKWINTGYIAIIIGGITGVYTWTVCNTWMNLSISTLFGSLLGGLIYSLISAQSLLKLTKKKQPVEQPQKRSLLESPPNSNNGNSRIIFLFIYLIIFGVGILILPSPIVAFKNSNYFSSFGLIAYFIFYQYLSTLVHEIGHWLFGLLNGFDLYCIGVDRWILVRTSKGFKLFKSHSIFAGGFVMNTAKNLDSLDKKLFIMIMGGPLASFLLFCIGLIPLLFRDLVSSNLVVWTITFFSFLNLYYAICNILPVKIGQLTTDGRRMLDLIQNNRNSRRFKAFHSISVVLRQGVRPKDLNPILINQVLAIPEKSSDHVSGLLIAYSVALDKNKFDQAGNFLDQALALISYHPELFRGTLLLEAAYFESHIRQRAEIARQWFEQIQEKIFVDPVSLLRSESALLLCEGDNATALTKAEEGLLIIQSYQSMSGSAKAEADRLQALITSCTTSCEDLFLCG